MIVLQLEVLIHQKKELSKNGTKDTMQNKTQDAILQIYEHYNYQCFICKSRAVQLAHLIGDTKSNRKRYGKDIIDNPLNVLPACNLKHNALIDISNNKIAESAIVDAITYAEKGAREYIEDIVRENISRKVNKKSSRQRR